MRIGIATLAHDNDNYGGTFQAVALQSYLQQQGHEAVLLNAGHGKAVPWLRSWKELFNHPVRKIQENRRHNTFVPFWEKYYVFDPEGHRSFEDFPAGVKDYDAVICGSDQVWHPQYLSQSAARNFFMLNFGDERLRRIAYAASLGSDTFPEEALAEIQACLQRFTAIGLRESAAIPEVERLGCQATWVCDPTLLHDATFWRGFMTEALPYSAEKTLVQLTYRWKTACSVEQVRSYFEKEKHLRTVIPFSHKPIHNFHRTQPLTPPLWLKAIDAASFVLTNSYHGMLFAIQFRRPFAVVPLAGRYTGMNARIRAVVERLGLSERMLTADTPAEIERCIASPIDWDDVATRLNAWRTQSVDFLTQALNA